jgi:hypothetical protein
MTLKHVNLLTIFGSIKMLKDARAIYGDKFYPCLNVFILNRILTNCKEFDWTYNHHSIKTRRLYFEAIIY